jgi:hypothetical protein
VERSFQIVGFWKMLNIKEISSLMPGNVCSESEMACGFNEAV